MKKVLYSILVTGMFTMPLVAKDLKGVLVNEKQKPIAGMKLWVKNTMNSVITGKNGDFFIEQLKESDTIVISVNKRQDAIIPMAGKADGWYVKLEKKSFILKIGNKEEKIEYTGKRRVERNNNIITRQQIEESRASDLYELLQGRVPGLNVETVDGEQRISLRGGTSLELDNEPLFVIDGTNYESSNEADRSVNINDIEKIEVYKDGSVFGFKGANGAIVITTKKL